ncbi:translation factor [Grosmannia clavigera kw1407]|uniref:Protein DOM34 homolog n=1 Tax=Grosmannia clavigera (strain kw1407 / UAMH 11150) TaxID=655863 RepID=F0X8N3_GROCL|nr:translation factor [Grosmannia clavigera kw1407]EFX05818.1 translation factor [Grosmannia clavigera kw1407]
MQIVKTKSTAEMKAIGEDFIALLPDEPEDMWHANNLIQPRDVIKAHAVRNLVDVTDTGSTTKRRVHTELIIRVETTFFDPVVSSLRVTGSVVADNPYVSKGQRHTLDLELHHPFVLWKSHGWDTVSTEELREAVRQDREGALAAVVMGEGQADICLITDYQTLVKQHVVGSLPKKLTETSEVDAGVLRFYGKMLDTLLRSIDFSSERLLLLASPGFSAQNFRKYMLGEAQARGDKVLKQIAKQAVVVHSSSGKVHALNEVLKSPEVAALLRDTKFRSENQAVDQLLERLRNDDGRVTYGVRPVEKAVQEGAVGAGGGMLLIINSLFRSLDVATRRRYVAIVDKVKADGGEAKILSSDHESGQRLQSLGGIAVITTYPIVDADEDEGENEVGSHVGESNGNQTFATDNAVADLLI